MRKLPGLALLLALAGVAVAGDTQHQQGGPGATTTVQVTRAPTPRINLAISDVQWLPPQPLTDESGFLKTASGLGSAAARGATLVPRLFVDAMTTTVGPQQRSSTAQTVIVSPVMRVKVKNNGTERWASTGEVHVTLFRGRAEDLPQSRPFSALIDESKRLLQISPNPPGRGTWVNELSYGTSIGQITGSIGPGGEEASVQVAFLNGISHPKDKMARYRFRMLVDKYYTARVSLMAKNDGTLGNDEADYVFRVGPNGAVLEGKLIQRFTEASHAQVTGGGVTVTHVSGACDNVALKSCNEFLGASYKSATVKKDCEKSRLAYLPKGCAADGRIGTCDVKAGTDKMTRFSFYAGYRAPGSKPGRGDVAEAQSQCGKLKGQWKPGD